jgi:hypothetical protein
MRYISQAPHSRFEHNVFRLGMNWWSPRLAPSDKMEAVIRAARDDVHAEQESHRPSASRGCSWCLSQISKCLDDFCDRVTNRSSSVHLNIYLEEPFG